MHSFTIAAACLAAAFTLTSGNARADDVSASFQHHCRADSDAFKTTEGGCKHLGSGLVWGMRALKAMNHADAEAYCEKLVDGRWNDWRLPKFEEVDALAKEGSAVAAFRFPLADMFWTHDNSSAPGATAMSLISAGDEAYKDKNDPSAVVCVRQSSTKAFGCLIDDERFTTSHGGCQYLATGTIWSRPAPELMDRFHAENYCTSLDVEGDRGQWSLPNGDDLYKASGPLASGTHLDLPRATTGSGTTSSYVWIDHYVAEYGYAFSCDLINGSCGRGEPRSNLHGVICIKQPK